MNIEVPCATARVRVRQSSSFDHPSPHHWIFVIANGVKLDEDPAANERGTKIYLFGHHLRGTMCSLISRIVLLLALTSRLSHGFVGLTKNPTRIAVVLKETGYSTDDGYSRIVEQSLWRRLFPKIDPGRAHLAEESMMGGVHHRMRKKQPGSLILVRNGESVANTTFAGWNDPDISTQGTREVRHAGRLLRETGYDPDVIFTSRLKRAIHSTWAILQEMDTIYLPVIKSWRLNGRHYGSLTGLEKSEVAETFGADLVQEWRTNPKATPPPMADEDPFWADNKRKFKDVDNIPRSESLVDCMERIEPLWQDKILPELQAGHNVLVVSHATTLRGLVKYVQDIDDDELDIHIPPGTPLVYEFDKKMVAKRPEGCSEKELWARFLEKPGLLEKLVKEEQIRKKYVPGYEPLTGDAAFSRPMNSLEQSLAKLNAEREFVQWSEDDAEDALPHNVNHITSAKLQLISQHPCLAPLPNGAILPANLTLPARKGATIVMVRHGKTEHNKLGLFTGWQDPALAPEGVEEAHEAGQLLKKYGFEFDVVYTSWLSRAIETAWLILDELDATWLPIVKSWRLNERNYGALTGKSKKMIARMYGEQQLMRWRRGYSVRPPPLNSFSPEFPGNDPRYVKFMTDVRYSVSDSMIRSIEFKRPTLTRKYSKTESLEDCNRRTIPFFKHSIMPDAVNQGKRILIASSENAIRGLLMHLCDIPEDKISQLNIPNGVPIIYDVASRSVKLIQEESGEDPLEKYDFGVAADYLFRHDSTTEEDVAAAEDEECDVVDISKETMAELTEIYKETVTDVVVGSA